MSESLFQKRVKSLLKQTLGCPIRSEVNVRKLFPGYPAANEHYDLVIDLYKVVIECHGEQHRSLVSFGKEDGGETVTKLVMQKHRDSRKEEEVWQNGWGYVLVWHNELPKADEKAKDFLTNKVLEAIKLRAED